MSDRQHKILNFSLKQNFNFSYVPKGTKRLVLNEHLLRGAKPPYLHPGTQPNHSSCILRKGKFCFTPQEGAALGMSAG